jgi:hypothetical protein
MFAQTTREGGAVAAAVKETPGKSLHFDDFAPLVPQERRKYAAVWAK